MAACSSALFGRFLHVRIALGLPALQRPAPGRCQAFSPPRPPANSSQLLPGCTCSYTRACVRYLVDANGEMVPYTLMETTDIRPPEESAASDTWN